jgi:2,3-bisphosphoglycerate-independent phosphoglycerate mutase
VVGGKYLKTTGYSLILVNFANLDRLGNRRSIEVAQKAAKTVDASLKASLSAIDSVDGNVLISADHGNVDKMVDVNAAMPFTQRITNPFEVLLDVQNSESSNSSFAIHCVILPRLDCKSCNSPKAPK